MQSAQDKTGFFNDLSATEKTGAGQKVWDGLVYQAARKKLAEYAPQQIRGHHIYEVAEGWETKVLKDDPAVMTVSNPSALREALADPDIKIIMVPQGSVMKRDTLADICEESTLAKTIFYEREENE